MARLRKHGKTPSGARPASRGKRSWILLLLLVIALFFGARVLTGPAGVFKISDLRAQREQVRTEIDSLEARRAELIEERKRLLSDTAYLEKLARKELGLARPGEKVYRLVDPQGAEKTSAGR